MKLHNDPPVGRMLAAGTAKAMAFPTAMADRLEAALPYIPLQANDDDWAKWVALATNGGKLQAEAVAE